MHFQQNNNNTLSLLTPPRSTPCSRFYLSGRWMDPTGPTPSASSTIASSCISTQSAPPTPSPLLEVSLISAQDLASVSKSMRTYAVAWVNPNRKLTTRTDQQGHTHPTWNDKFTFCMGNQALNVEIYTASWLRPLLVGTTQVLITDLVAPPTQSPPDKNHTDNKRFITLQVRRPSGAPQGILTMGVSLLESTMRSTPLQRRAKTNNKIEKKLNPLKQEDQLNKENLQISPSLADAKDFPLNSGSVCNGGSIVNGSVCNSSIVNGSELCSDIGPSASVVAAELANKAAPPPPPLPAGSIINARAEETGSIVLQELTLEQARAKGYNINIANTKRCRKENIYTGDQSSELSIVSVNRNSRRKSGKGLFSCFGNSYGIEVRIVCGASNNPGSKKPTNSVSRKKIKQSSEN